MLNPRQIYEQAFTHLEDAKLQEQVADWSCVRCTLLNTHEALSCVMCEAPAPSIETRLCSSQAEYHYIEAAFYFFQACADEADEKSKALVAEKVAGLVIIKLNKHYPFIQPI